MERLTARERLLRTIAGEPVDRIPIRHPITWHPLSPDPAPGDWKALPNYQRLIPLVVEKCDLYVPLAIPGGLSGREVVEEATRDTGRGSFLAQRFLLSPPERVEVTEEVAANGDKSSYYRLRTPKGDLSARYLKPARIDTRWTVEPLVKDAYDAEKLLSVPYRFDTPDLSPYFAEVKRLGDRGVPVCRVSSPLAMITHLTGLERFLLWTITERALIERMVATAYERVAGRLQYVLNHGVGPIVRFSGCERATPPMMSKRLFDQFVLKYERPLWRMAREADRIVWVHCHGKVSAVLDDFVAGGVHVLDPVEPPPQGDIEIGEAKRRAAAGPMTLMGNVEMSDLLTLRAPDEVEALVKGAVCEGGRDHFILSASAVVIEEVDDRARDNLVRFIEAGVKYGTFGLDQPGCEG